MNYYEYNNGYFSCNDTLKDSRLIPMTVMEYDTIISNTNDQGDAIEPTADSNEDTLVLEEEL